MAILALLRLAKTTDNADFGIREDASLLAFHNHLTGTPQAVPLMTKAAAFAMRELFRAVIAGDPAASRGLLRPAARGPAVGWSGVVCPAPARWQAGHDCKGSRDDGKEGPGEVLHETNFR